VLGDLDTFARSYGLVVAVLVCGIGSLAYVVRRLYSDNQALHAKLLELLDQRGKYLDSILSEAIREKTDRIVP
jgi:hypothetical protein